MSDAPGMIAGSFGKRSGIWSFPLWGEEVASSSAARRIIHRVGEIMPVPLRLLPLLFASLPLRASITGPYTADANTRYLFHFDEAAGPSSAANPGSTGLAALSVDGNPYAGDSTNQPPITTVLGAAGYSGFGNAANLTGDACLGVDADGNGAFRPGDYVPAGPDQMPDHSSLFGSSNAFTLEAMIKLPSITGGNREIICTDNNSGTAADRGFQFRISDKGSLEFNFIGTTPPAFAAPIPTTGTHAFTPDAWFHVALAHDGTTMTFYWTRVDPSVSAANAIATNTTETVDVNDDAILVIGNEGRATNGLGGEPLGGLIDEVRLSSVARGPGDFIFEPLDLVANTDNDLLPDAWELIYADFLDELSGLEDADHDHDGATDLAEYNAGSDPFDPLSTPTDTDGDTLPDPQEIFYFGSLSQGPSGDPDGDGESTATELANGSAPNHRASGSTDLDADFLPDAWEQSHFSHLDHNGGSDPDGDGFGTLQESIAATNPANAASRPSGAAVKLVPLDDGNRATSDFGYAGASAINTVAFVRSSLKTIGDQQFVTWYGRHQHDATAAFNNTIWIGRRALGSSEWQIFRHPTFTANAIADGHDVISYGIDGDGYMHLSWGMHGDAFHYSRSTAPVTGTDPIVLGPDTTMTGRENSVTYPQFLKLPDGDLLYLFREVASGNGDTFLNRYDTATRTWDNVHRSGTTRLPFIKGTGWTPNYNAYPNMPQLGGDGDDLTLTWCWRYEPTGNDSPAGEDGYQTNNTLAFGRSTDGGLTWQRHDGTPYALPISRNGESGDPATAAEHIVTIPEGSSLVNQAGMCLDGNGNPVTATWWAPGAQSVPANHRRQYMIAFRHDDGTWQTRPVSNRTLNPTTTKYSESAVRDLGRPVVVNDDADRIIVAYRDDAGTNGITIVHSLPKAQDPDRLVWIEFDLTRDNLGNFEPIIDNELWDRDRQLHILYQASQGEGYVPPANTADRISVLEWDAARYFAHSPQVSVAKSGTVVTLTCPSGPSWSYRLWRSNDLDDWELVEERAGTGEDLVFTHAAAIGETKRFWRIEFVEGGF